MCEKRETDNNEKEKKRAGGDEKNKQFAGLYKFVYVFMVLNVTPKISEAAFFHHHCVSAI